MFNKIFRNAFWLGFLRVLIEIFIVNLSFYIGYHFYMRNFDIALYSSHCLELDPSLYYLPTLAGHYFTVAIGLSAILFVVFSYLRLYSNDNSLLNVKEYRKVVIGFIASIIVFLALYYFFVAYTAEDCREKLFSRRILAYSLSICLVLIVTVRAFINFFIKYLHAHGKFVNYVFIYGAGAAGKLTARRLYQCPAVGLCPIGFIDDDPELLNQNVVYDPALNKSLKVIANQDSFVAEVKKHKISEVIITMPSVEVSQTISIFNLCKKHHILFRFVPNTYEIAVQKTKTDEIMGLPIISLKVFNKKIIYRLLKRFFDLLLSLIILFFAAPIMLLIAILIKKDSQGPVLFVQQRVGLNRVPFNMMKFRTMYANQSKDATTPDSICDPRITKFGRFLRKSSLDELPQLFNVLNGSMSLVGPRPEMTFIVEQYKEIHLERLKVKPGITGLWQISADRKLAIHENLDYDLYYIQEQSLLIDFVILVQTIFFAFKGI